MSRTMTNADVIAISLSPPAALERRCIALATLDAILSPEWQYRYYSFNRNWDPQAGTRMASMRDGSGNAYFILFFPDGSAAIKGFEHESPALVGCTAIPGVLEGLPPSFSAFVSEPAFSMQNVTFCLWTRGGHWERSTVIDEATIARDGSNEMLRHVVGSAEDYADYARDYFELDVPAHAIARIFRLEPLTRQLAEEIRRTSDLDEITTDLDEIGYPVPPHE